MLGILLARGLKLEPSSLDEPLKTATVQARCHVERLTSQIRGKSSALGAEESIGSGLFKSDYGDDEQTQRALVALQRIAQITRYLERDLFGS